MGASRRGSAPEGALPTSSTEGRYRIHVVAEKTGVPAATLRAWERRYGIPAPARTESAYRLYSDRDVELVRALSELCAAGMAPAEAARQVRESVATPAATGAPAPASAPLAGMVTIMLDAVARFDHRALDAAIAQALTLGPATAVFEQVVAPVQVEVGERWHDGALTVGQEHFATEALAAVVHGLHRLVQPIDGRLALLACAGEENHTLPLYGAALRLASAGYRTVVLGARTPPSGLEAARRALEPEVIGLSLTTAVPLSQAGPMFAAYARAAGDVPWVVGGRAAGAVSAVVEAAGGAVMSAQELAQGRLTSDGPARRARGAR